MPNACRIIVTRLVSSWTNSSLKNEEPQKQTLPRGQQQQQNRTRVEREKKNNNHGRGTRQGNMSALTLFSSSAASRYEIEDFFDESRNVFIYSGKRAKTPGVWCTSLRQITPFSTPLWFNRSTIKLTQNAKCRAWRPPEHWNADRLVLNYHKEVEQRDALRKLPNCRELDADWSRGEPKINREEFKFENIQIRRAVLFLLWMRTVFSDVEYVWIVRWKTDYYTKLCGIKCTF